MDKVPKCANAARFSPSISLALGARAARVLTAVAMLAPGCAPNAETAVGRWRDPGWPEQHQKFVERARRGRIDLLFLGDSITQGWNPEVWERFYAPRGAEHFGIGGDRTQHLLWRIRNGELDGIEPHVVVILIGTNNLSDDPAGAIERGVAAIVAEVRSRLPESRLVLLGILPRSEKPDALRDKTKEVNARIARLDDGARVKYVDVGRALVRDDDTISRDVMPDFIHLTRKGYRLVAEALEPTLWAMLNESR